MTHDATLPFAVREDDVVVGGRRLRVCRPADPRQVRDPDAEAGAAGPVWAHLWSSGGVLAEQVLTQDLAGVRVLELGCGLGLVSVAAAAAGARVTASDRSLYALAFAAVNAEVNGLAIEAVACEWADPSPLTSAGPWDLILGADVLYDERGAGRLLTLLDRLAAPGCEVWLADPGRAPAAAFLAAAAMDWRLRGRWSRAGVSVHRLVRA